MYRSPLSNFSCKLPTRAASDSLSDPNCPTTILSSSAAHYSYSNLKSIASLSCFILAMYDLAEEPMLPLPVTPPDPLRHPITYPTIGGLKFRNDPLTPYHRPAGPHHVVRIRHCCFTGEIVEALPIRTQLVLRVRGRDDECCVVAFVDGDFGAAFEGIARVGRVIAIIDPILHRFEDGTMGIRVDDGYVRERRVNILPYTLWHLLEADRLIQRKTSNPRCLWCHKPCSFPSVWYDCLSCGTLYCKCVST